MARGILARMRVRTVPPAKYAPLCLECLETRAVLSTSMLTPTSLLAAPAVTPSSPATVRTDGPASPQVIATTRDASPDDDATYQSTPAQASSTTPSTPADKSVPEEAAYRVNENASSQSPTVTPSTPEATEYVTDSKPATADASIVVELQRIVATSNQPGSSQPGQSAPKLEDQSNPHPGEHQAMEVASEQPSGAAPSVDIGKRNLTQPVRCQAHSEAWLPMPPAETKEQKPGDGESAEQAASLSEGARNLSPLASSLHLGLLPFDLPALEQGMQSFLSSLEQLGDDLPDVGFSAGPALWVSAAMGMVAGYEYARRLRARTGPDQGVHGSTQSATWTWFSDVALLPPDDV